MPKKRFITIGILSSIFASGCQFENPLSFLEACILEELYLLRIFPIPLPMILVLYNLVSVVLVS